VESRDGIRDWTFWEDPVGKSAGSTLGMDARAQAHKVHWATLPRKTPKQ